MLFIVLILLIAFPLLMVAIALKSLAVAIVGLSLGFIYLSVFLFNAFPGFTQELKATSADGNQEERLQKLWREAGPERVEARFWIYPSSDAQFKVWARTDKKIEIFMSLGLMQLATDSGLKAAFQSMATQSFAEVRLQNRRHALTDRFQRLKGPQEDFRYWFISFWLYPLERLVKVARL